MIPIKARTCCAALAALVLLPLSPAPSHAQGPAVPPVLGTSVPVPATTNVIVVNGQGSVDAAPDQATVGLGVQVIRPTAQEAQDQSSTVMDEIVRQVMAVGIPREKIRTTNVSLFPVRRPGPGTPQITGYEAVNRVTVTVDTLRLTGRVIDAAVAAGANSVDSLTFGLRDPSPYRMRAFRLAVQNAQATASAIASAAGLSNLRVVRIDEIGPLAAVRVIAAPSIQGAATPVEPGTVPVSVLVRAVYAF